MAMREREPNPVFLAAPWLMLWSGMRQEQGQRPKRAKMLYYEEWRKSPNLLKRFNTLPALSGCAAKPNGADPASKRGETPGRDPH